MQRNAATEAEAAVVADVVARFPWFVPARYAQAAAGHAKKAFSAEMLTMAYPYTGNWLLFLDHIKRVPLPATTIGEAIPAAVEEIITPELQRQLADETEEAAPANEGERIAEEMLVTEPEVTAEEVVDETQAVEILPATDAEPIEETKEEQEEVTEEMIFTPVQSDDYFMQQGISVSSELPGDIHDLAAGHDEAAEDENDERSLMVMMSFTEWLVHFKRTTDNKNSELEDQKAVRAMWQKEKLAAALEEENDEIPENVFEMAVNSIAKEEGLASESLAEIYLKQGKYDHAIEMYKKLSLRNPQKNAYFAAKIDEIIKEKK